MGEVAGERIRKAEGKIRNHALNQRRTQRHDSRRSTQNEAAKDLPPGFSVSHNVSHRRIAAEKWRLEQAPSRMGRHNLGGAVITSR